MRGSIVWDSILHCSIVRDSKRPKVGQPAFWSCGAHSPPMSLACCTSSGVTGFRAHGQERQHQEKGSTGKSGKNPVTGPGLSLASFSPPRAKSWFSQCCAWLPSLTPRGSFPMSLPCIPRLGSPQTHSCFPSLIAQPTWYRLMQASAE